MTKNTISNVETRGRLLGIAEVDGVGLLDGREQRQSFMLFAEGEGEMGVGFFWWGVREYGCLLVGGLRLVEWGGVFFFDTGVFIGEVGFDVFG